MSGDTALLIIDIQTGMFDEKDPVNEGDKLLQILAGLTAKAHQSGMPVIYVQHSGGDNHILHSSKPGWPIHPAIAPQPHDLIVHKHHPDSFQETNLQVELHRLGIKNLVVAGIQTEYCVDTTCRRTYSLGYDVTLVEDGHSTWDNTHLNASQIIAHHNETLGGWFVNLKPADSIKFDPLPV